MTTNLNLRLLNRLAWGGFGAAILFCAFALFATSLPGGQSDLLFVLAAIAFIVGLNSHIARIAVHAVLDVGSVR
jgi:hypothetical protein